MVIYFEIWSFCLLYFSIDAKSHRFGLNISHSKDGCIEYINHCDPVNTLLKNSTCYNIKLPYQYTVQNKDFLQLEYWYPVKAIPKCWTYLKTLICSLNYPECDPGKTESFIKKVDQGICQATRRECSVLIVNNLNNENNSKNRSTKSKLNFINSIVEKTPFFLDCDKYPPICQFDFHKRLIHHNDLKGCQWPMVNTVQKSLWIEGFDGCSFHCKTPFLSKEEYQFTKSIFGVAGVIFSLFNVFVLITFALHQFQHSQYKWHPMLLNLFIIHFYLLIASLGWLMQLIPGIGYSIVCRSDGALQIREPQVRIGESFWCVVVFSMIYFSLFASNLTSLSFFYSILSVISQYSCCWSQGNITNTSENLNNSNGANKIPFLKNKILFSLRKSEDKNTCKFTNPQIHNSKPEKGDEEFSGIAINGDSIYTRNHSLSSQVFVVLISAFLLIISLTIGEIKGDPLSGICFVSNESMMVRICLALLPLTIILMVLSIIMNIIIFHIRNIQRHLDLYASSQRKVYSKRMSKTVTFYVFILLFLWMFWCFSVYTHSYIYQNERLWYEALKNQFLCKLRQSLLPTVSVLDSEFVLCPLERRPSINVFILHSFSYFSINIIFLICTLFNKHWIQVWKSSFIRFFYTYGSKFKISRNKSCTTQPENDLIIEKLYFGLQNRSLLDSIWNPGVFVYLNYKDEKRRTDQDNLNSIADDKTITLGSGENSSASYCLYQRDGSLRSCVSMPPITVVGQQNVCQCSQNLSHEKEICPTLENFLKGTQNFIGQNSVVRRSNSYAGRPHLITTSPMDNISIPNSCYQSGTVNQRNPCFKEHFMTNNNFINHSGISHLTCSNNSCQTHNQTCTGAGALQRQTTLNGCISMSHLNARRNTLENASVKFNKSLRRFSMTFDRKNEKGVSSKSTLNRRKRTARYSISPKSISKTLINQSIAHSRLGIDPSSRNSSSFSGESYNSYNLMSQQIGGRWRDICRTRMTLHDVMVWAKAVSQCHIPMHGICHNNLCNYAFPVDTCNQSIGSKLLAMNKPCSCSSNVPLSTVYQPNNPTSNAFKVNDNSSTVKNLEQEKENVNTLIANSHVSINLSNESSDKFNSEDEIVSVDNSAKNSPHGSEEFCSDDEVISLINCENQ